MSKVVSIADSAAAIRRLQVLREGEAVGANSERSRCLGIVLAVNDQLANTPDNLRAKLALSNVLERIMGGGN